MSRRNNIINMLMDKVPRRNKDLPVTQSSNEGYFMLLELDDLGEIFNFMGRHRVYSELPHFHCDADYQTFVAAATEWQVPGNWGVSYLFKIRVKENDHGGLDTPFGALAMRHARMYVITHNGEFAPQYDRGMSSSSTISREQIIEESKMMPVLVSGITPNLDPEDFDPAVHCVRVEQ